MAETPNPYVREVYTVREVGRLLDKSLHDPERSVANFRGDLEGMLADGEFYGLEARDLRFLDHALRVCIRPRKRSPEGAVVSLSNRQWGAFIGIRRKYLWHRHNPANLINLIKTRRALAETLSTEAVPVCPDASNPSTQNETH